MTGDVFRLLVLCAIVVDGQSLDWSLIARAAQAGHLDALYDGVILDAAVMAAGRDATSGRLRAGLADLGDATAKVQLSWRLPVASVHMW